MRRQKIRRPRRPVRTNRVTSALRTALITFGVVGFGSFMAAERFPEFVPWIVQITSAERVSGPVTRVRDGDTIEVNGTPIRFGSLDCPERKTSAGRSATARMQDAIQGDTLTCYLNGRESWDRKIGNCRLSDGTDLGALMIQSGLCRRYW